MPGWTVVLDIGKTHSKATLWDEGGRWQAQRAYANCRADRGRSYLDSVGIEAWLERVLIEFATTGPIDAIVPVAHGAGVAILNCGGGLRLAPLDYEWDGVSSDRQSYDRQRDPFAQTGSPALPAGLNLGIQLHWLEGQGESFRDAHIVPWAQYWAWLLCGEAATEITSLGCHSDLWRPLDSTPSELCIRRGWAERLAPITPAGQVLGTLTPQWVARTGLSSAVCVYCGLHDSNAALFDARSHGALRGRDSTMLSTGTWFVAMRSPLHLDKSLLAALPEHRDCLVNVDCAGSAVPSSRFMGGREIELLTANSPQDLSTTDRDQQILVRAIKTRRMILPSAIRGVGPFPSSFRSPTDQEIEHPRIESQLYAAMLADVSLDLIGSCDTLLVEGRFAAAPAFVRALASLRPRMKVLIGADEHGVARGALRLAGIECVDRPPLFRVDPLPVDVAEYKSIWREAAERTE